MIYTRILRPSAGRDFDRIIANCSPQEAADARHCLNVFLGLLRYDPQHLADMQPNIPQLRAFNVGLLRFFFVVVPDDRLAPITGIMKNPHWEY